MREVPEIRPGTPFPTAAVSLDFARSGGPGGQNVNKVETKVIARLDLTTLRGLSDSDRLRIRERLASRLDARGQLIVTAQAHRSRERNVEDALERMRELIGWALRRPKPRTATRPTRASRQRKLDVKHRRGAVKRGRGPVRDDG